MFGEQEYQVIPNGYAVLEEENSSSSFPFGHDGDRLYGNFGPYQVFIASGTDTLVPAESILQMGTEKRYQLALNIGNEQTVIMTGQIAVHMLDPNASQAVADAYGLTIEADFKDINRVFFSTQSGQDIIGLTELLNFDVAVELAEVDILEEFYEPF